MRRIKNIFPKSLLGRTLLILVTPLILLQLVSGIIFFATHLDKITYRLSRSVAADVAVVMELMERYPGSENLPWIFQTANKHFRFYSSYRENAELKPRAEPVSGMMEVGMAEALEDIVVRPFTIDTKSLKRSIVLHIQLPGGVLDIITSRKRLFSTTAYVFVLWMIGTSLILFGIATIFMRNQVRPIRKLAAAAAAFGKGRQISQFKPEGATEVRQAATAFIAMRERIARQIAQRTDMLAGVSHDLRTPLTRMKLQLAMQEDNPGTQDLKNDIVEMEHMLEGYLAFARGEGQEKAEPSELGILLNNIVSQAQRKGGKIDLHVEGDITLSLRPISFKRALTNLLENAMRYADHISVRAGVRNDMVEITIDDDGPGIPENQRTEVFKPFFRLDNSRNQETGGVGLGLSITQDAIQKHGGDIELSDSPFGGLRARVRLPV